MPNKVALPHSLEMKREKDAVRLSRQAAGGGHRDKAERTRLKMEACWVPDLASVTSARRWADEALSHHRAGGFLEVP